MIFTLINLLSVGNNAINSSKSLLDNIFTDYNNNVIPINDFPLNLSMGLALRSLNKVDQLQGIITSNVWLRYYWNDKNLKWNPEDYNNISFLSLKTDHEYDMSIWVPDIYLYNTAENPLENLASSNALVHSNGDILWSRPGMITSTCSFQLRDFPYDQQNCTLKFGSWSYSGIFLNLLKDSLDISNYQTNEEWDLIETTITKNTEYYSCCPEPYYDITFNLIVRRKNGYYNLNIILPTFATASLMILTLIVPWDSGERISFAATVMLSLIVFLLILSENLPKSDEKPLLSRMLIGLTLFSLISLVFTILLSAMHSYKNAENKLIVKIIKKINKLCKCIKCNIQDNIHKSFYRTTSYTNAVNNKNTENKNTENNIENNNQNIENINETCQDLANSTERFFSYIFLFSFILYCIISFQSIPEY